MEITIIGVYDDHTHANSAKNELLASGFERASVQLNPDHEPATAAGSSMPAGKDGSVSAAIGNFFRSMFGVGDKSTHSNVYAEAVRRGSYVLTVDVVSDEQRVGAERIMNRHGPIDIEERSAKWLRQGWRGYDPGAPMMTRDEIRQERSRHAQENPADQGNGGGKVQSFQRGAERLGNE